MKRFLEGTADREEVTTIVRHLLARCAGCAGVLETLWRGRPGSDRDYDQAIERSAERALAAFAPQAR